MKAIATVCATLCVLTHPFALAADQPLQRLSQQGHAVWRTRDGAFNSPNGLAQTKDGYLWIGTDAGLVRFDGARFVPANVYPEGSIADWQILSVFAADDGGLWIGAVNHVAHLKDGHLTRHDIAGRANQFVEDEQGTVWFAKSRSRPGSGPVCRVDDQDVRCYGPPEIPFRHASVVRKAGGNDLWIGSSGALCRWSAGREAECFLRKALQPLEGLDGVTSLLAAKDGTLWVGLGKAGHDLGLGQLANGQWKPLDVPGLDGSTLNVSALIEDRHGSVWIGTNDRGIYRVHGGRAEHFGAENGLSGNTVSARAVLEDREGTVWVATTSGLDAFRRLPVTVFSTREGLEADSVESILPASNGTVWVGNLTLSTLVGDQVRPPPLPAFFRGREVSSLMEDHAGRIWVGLEKSLYVLQGGIPMPVTALDGGPLGAVQVIFEDAAHDVWVKIVGTPARVFRIRHFLVADDFTEKLGDPFDFGPDPTRGIWVTYFDGRFGRYRDDVLEIFPAPKTAEAARAYDLAVGPDGQLFVATSAGLVIQQDSSQLLLDTRRGMPCNGLQGILKDASGSVWISASCGLIRIDETELDRWRANPETRIGYRLLDVTDGYQPGRGAFVPHMKLGADGRLWLANGKIAQVVDPKAFVAPSTAPPVRIEEVTADRVVYGRDDTIRLPVNPRDIDIRFTALTFVVPQKVSFRYRLEGRDPGWRDAGTARQAFYTDLPPGRYRFRVEASASDGVWNGSGSSVDLEIPPAYYQTRWFLAIIVAVGAALLYGLYVVRLRQVALGIRDRLAAKNDERERIARNLHDTLLQGTQALIYNVHAAADRVAPDDPVRRMLEHAIERADALMAEGRERIQGLRITDDVGSDLYASLCVVGEEMARSRHVAFEAVVEGPARPLTATVRDEAYQIGREALLNAFNHANAKSIEVQVIHGDDQFRLRIRDDGIGIDVDSPGGGARPGHWGLKGMRERADGVGGSLDIWSGAGAGTEVELRVPSLQAYRHVSAPQRWSWLRDLMAQER